MTSKIFYYIHCYILIIILVVNVNDTQKNDFDKVSKNLGSTKLNFLHNYFNGPKKLFSDINL